MGADRFGDGEQQRQAEQGKQQLRCREVCRVGEEAQHGDQEHHRAPLQAAVVFTIPELSIVPDRFGLVAMLAKLETHRFGESVPELIHQLRYQGDDFVIDDRHKWNVDQESQHIFDHVVSHAVRTILQTIPGDECEAEDRHVPTNDIPFSDDGPKLLQGEQEDDIEDDLVARHEEERDDKGLQFTPRSQSQLANEVDANVVLQNQVSTDDLADQLKDRSGQEEGESIEAKSRNPALDRCRKHPCSDQQVGASGHGDESIFAVSVVFVVLEAGWIFVEDTKVLIEIFVDIHRAWGWGFGKGRLLSQMVLLVISTQ